MISAVLISLLVGMVFAQRCKVLVLLPTILLIVILTVALGLARAETRWIVSETAALVIVAVQIGYFLGIAARHFMLLARASRINSGSLSSVARWRRAAH
jgi:hypothetical protein